MTHPYALVLAFDRKSGSLPPEAVDIARAMVKGARPVTLSDGEAVEIPCGKPGAGAATPATIRAALAPHRVDALLVKQRGRRKAVLIADMDSTILADETLDQLAALLGCGDAVKRITEATMNGALDFASALTERVALLRGHPAELLEDVWQSTRLNEGARTLVRTMHIHNARTALVSGGFTCFTSRVAELCGFDEHHGNVLGIENGLLTGRLDAAILGPDSKKAHLIRLLTERGAQPSAALATGDGANDLPMLHHAGFGVAFYGKPKLRAEVALQINFSTLRSLLFAQGYRAEDFVV